MLTSEFIKDDLIRLFTDNAFMLLANKQRIMQDSRMSFAPIAVRSGLAYCGLFHPATLGAYIEWWSVCAEALRMNGEGEKTLVYQLAGSPLSGANRCMQVYEDGRAESVEVNYFSALWHPFVEIVNRYAKEQNPPQAYTLQEVIDILSSEEGGETKDYVQSLFLEAKVRKCEVKLQAISKERDEFRRKYVSLLLKNKEEQVRAFYDKYLALQKEVDEEVADLKEKRKALRRKLRNGDFSNVSYQRELTPISRKLRGLPYSLIEFRSNGLWTLFPNECITLEDIELYFENIKG